MKKYTSLCLGLSLLVTPISFGAVFSYSLEGYPKENRNCHVQSKSIANRFESATKLKVLHTECTGETETGFNFVIEYESETKLNFTSTDYNLLSTYQRGRYKEIKDCETNLSKQTEIFEQATGLKPMFSYCSHPGLSSDKPWEIIITAPGKSILQPKLDGFVIFTQPQKTTYSEIFNGLKTAIEKRNSILSDLIFSSAPLMVQANIHYYSKDHLQFRLEHVTKVPKIEHCLAQAEEAKSWFKSSINPPFTIYCGGPLFGEFELNIGIIEKASFTWQNSIEKFKSFEECQDNRAEVLAHYAGSSLKQILAGLCSKDFNDNSYRIVIFREAKQ